MKPKSFQFRFSGPEGASNATETKSFLSSEFSDWPLHSEALGSQTVPGSATRGDTIDLITLGLSIPGAILAGWDLTVRLKLKAKFDRLIAWALDRHTRLQHNPFITLPNGQSAPLHEIRTEQLLDIVALC